MSVRFDGATDEYFGASVVGTTGWTVTCWAKLQVDRNNYSTIFAWDGAADDGLWFQTTDSGTSLMVWDGTSDRPFSIGAMSVGTWMFYALTRPTSTSVTLYAGAEDGALSSQTITTSSTGAYSAINVGNSPDSEWLNGNVANLQCYSALLTQTEIEAERQSWDAVRTSGLVRHHRWRDAAETVDYSGNGRSLSVGGSPTFAADNPPITGTSAAAGFLPILMS